MISSAAFEEIGIYRNVKISCTGGNMPRVPSNLECEKSSSLANNSLWSRELENLISNRGLTKEMSGDRHDPFFPTRNKRKLVKEGHCISRKRPRVESPSILDARISHKELQPKWRKYGSILILTAYNLIHLDFQFEDVHM
jgi:hypothetical protein